MSSAEKGPGPGPGPRKKRKGLNGNVITIGKHVISLEAYHTAPPAAKPEAAGSEAKEPTRQSLAEPKKHVSKGPKARGPSQITEKEFGDAALLKTRRQLPIWQHRGEIQSAVQNNDVLVLVGETGSGKSTQVPQFLYREPWCRRRKVVSCPGDDAGEAAGASPGGASPGGAEPGQDLWVGGMVAITQPRRVAATTLAHRVAQEAGTRLGTGPSGLVGYSVRFDHRVPKGAKIKFMTEGMLLQELLQDPNLRQYSVVIVDEIHERSIDVDLLVGFLKQIIQGDKRGRGGVPLKVVIMSATADVDAFQAFFASKGGDSGTREAAEPSGVEVVRIKGRQHPVQVIHAPKPVPDIQDALLKAIFKIHVHEALPGDILAFLTGQEEIEAAQRLVEEYAATLDPKTPKLVPLALYGQLSIEAQHQAFQPLKDKFARKVVLATNIAETSVTVPGVRFVVDCGKAKLKQFRPRLGMESLLAKPISKSSAIQRTGRAGREAPGKCHRLYTESSFSALEPADQPEILRNDVLGAVLTMKARGVDDVTNFPLIDCPDPESIHRALVYLDFLGALDERGAITSRGREMARFPVTAPYARVLLAGAEPRHDCLLEVIDIIACLTAGEDIFHHVQAEEARDEVEALRRELLRREGDLMTYLTTMQLYVAENADRTHWCRSRKINVRNMKQALNIRRQLRAQCVRMKLLNDKPPLDPQPFVPASPSKAEAIIKCFVAGFAFKSAILMPDFSYVTTRGRQVVAIHPSSVLHGQKKEAILFLEHVFTQKSYAKKVSVVQPSWIVDALE